MTIDGESTEPPRLLGRLRFARRANHYAYRTEHAYLTWAFRLIRHDGKPQPQEMDGLEATDGASYPAVLLPGVQNKAPPKPSLAPIWKDPVILTSTIAPHKPTQFQIGVGTTFVGDADLFYTGDTVTTQHAIIEMSMALSLFGGHPIKSILWSPAGGNSFVSVSVPEPASVKKLATSHRIH